MPVSKAKPARKKAAKKSASEARGTKPVATRSAKPGANADVAGVVRWLEQNASKAVRDGMARYAIPSEKAFGISVGSMRAHAKKLGTNHALALKLWDTGWYEARMLATFLDDPAEVTPAQMDAWCRDFDNWAVCDTACFHLFNRTPHATKKVEKWARSRSEFEKRAAFALLACLPLKAVDEAFFTKGLELVETAADDERNFVAKAVNWALRSIGEKTPALNRKAVAVAERLAESEAKIPRWIGKDALRSFKSPAVQKRLAARAEKAAPATKAATKR